MAQPQRILFLGSGAFGLPTLRAIAASAGHRLVGVVSQPDKPAGRGGRVTPTPIAQWAGAEAASTPLLKPADINAPEARDRVRAISADVWLVIAFGQKLSPALLEGRTAVNLHASRLPRWRGAAPINAAILAGDTETGNTVITLADRMDAGLVLGQTRRAIDPLCTAGELHDALAADGPGLVLEVLGRIAAEGLSGAAQDEGLVTRARKLGRADAWVDFSAPAEECRRRVHGLTPWPGVAVGMGGKEVKLLRVRPDQGRVAAAPGTVLDGAGGLVACGDGSVLCMLEVQPAGGRPMAWAEFARGHRVTAGTIVAAGRPTC